MEARHREVLRAKQLVLVRELRLSEAMLAQLFQEQVLEEEHLDLIDATPTQTGKTRLLLRLLPRCGPQAFPAFLRSLEEHSWLRELLLEELRSREEQDKQQEEQQEEQGPGAAGVCGLPPSVLLTVPSDRALSRVALGLGGRWEAVLLELGVSWDAVSRCRSDHAHDAHGAALAALMLWRRGRGRSATLALLRDALEGAGLHPRLLQDAIS